jgi:TPR repeat protein
MIENGEGVTKSESEAMKWYGLAAEQGYPHAQLRLGLAYATGQGVERNYINAYEWLSLSAAQGESTALTSLNNVESLMTPSQIEEAQKLAHDWRASHATMR